MRIDNKPDTDKNIAIKDFIKECDLKLIQGDLDYQLQFSTVNVNRPGLLLAGFEDYFGDKRVQVIGNAEYYYLLSCVNEERKAKYHTLFSRNIPCVIYSNGYEPDKIACEIAKKHNIPLFVSDKMTATLVNELVTYLNVQLAPSTAIHGVLLEISGIGVLLTGRSGMGKSETAIELIHRGHRLVADDSVIVKQIRDEITGTSPDAIRHFMEIRGIGIIDVRSMFGVGSVLKEKTIDLVIEFEEWKKNMEYDRLGSEMHTQNILGVEIPKLIVPVMPGRNLAIVVEVAARNLRLKKLGYNAFESLLANVKF